jgi:hypothetical protein
MARNAQRYGRRNRLRAAGVKASRGGERARRGNPERGRRIGIRPGLLAPGLRLGRSMPNERADPASAWRSVRCGLPLVLAALAAGCAEPSGPDTAGPATGSGASLEGRIPFPADNPWNTEITGDAVDPNSGAYIAACGLRNLHPDFGTVWNGAPNGIPYVVVSGRQARVPVSFEYADESDPGPFPIPADAPIEGGAGASGDSHVLVIDADAWVLYELFGAYPEEGGKRWRAGSGAIFDLKTNALRPAGWTSADAAGLPIFPGLVRYDEAVERGEIRHALRFTCPRTRRAYVHPARHFASTSTDPDLPPMGMRVRLRADFDVSGFPPAARVVLTALKKYGMFVADNGSGWFISGAPDPRWDDAELATLRTVPSSAFEVVRMGPLSY